MMMADDCKSINNPYGTTLDVLGFLVFDKFGNTLAYGTGPVIAGKIDIGPTTADQ
jgi:hypothetical protein